MAPKNWNNPTIESSDDPSLKWCAMVNSEARFLTDVPLAVGTAVGTGAGNTAAMAASVGCNSDAAAAVLAYGGANASVGQWFLPSQDELNSMYAYIDSISDAAEFGFVGDVYWSSSQLAWWGAHMLIFFDGIQEVQMKDSEERVRPIRAF